MKEFTRGCCYIAAGLVWEGFFYWVFHSLPPLAVFLSTDGKMEEGQNKLSLTGDAVNVARIPLIQKAVLSQCDHNAAASEALQRHLLLLLWDYLCCKTNDVTVPQCIIHRAKGWREGGFGAGPTYQFRRHIWKWWDLFWKRQLTY